MDTQNTAAVVTQVADEPVRVRLTVTKQARADYLAATGRTVGHTVEATVPPEVLDEATRRVIAAWPEREGFRGPCLSRHESGEIVADHSSSESWYHAPLVPRITEDWRTLVADWQARELEAQEKAEREAAEARERQERAVAAILAATPEELVIVSRRDPTEHIIVTTLQGTLSGWLQERGVSSGWLAERDYRAVRGALPKDASVLVQARRISEERTAEAQAEKERQREEARARKEAAELAAAEERAAWIHEHGSRRLRKLLEEDIEHDAVYRDERLALERPGWAWNRMPGESSDPRNPPEEALELLDQARASVPEPERKSVHLAYWTVEPSEPDPYDYEERTVRGYTCTARFLGRDIVFRVDKEGIPPVVID